MTTPAAEYVAQAGQQDFDVPFPYLDKRHVEVLVNSNPASVLEWVNPTRLRLVAPLAGGELVWVRRNTPVDQALVQFHNGAVLTEEDLNLAVQQLLYKQQELQYLYERAVNGALIRIGNANGLVETDPEAVVAEIANLVLEEEVLANFRQRIADIDLSATQLAQQAIQIADQGAQIIQQATSTATLDAALTDLRNDHEALSGVVDALASLEDGTGLATVIQQEADARIAGDTALAATISLIGAKNSDSSAFLLDLNRVRVSPSESLATRLNAINASIGDNLALIQAEQTARADAISAEASARESLGTTLRGEISAAVLEERNARVAADEAEAAARQGLAAEVDDLDAAIIAEQQARVAGDQAEATARTNLAATLRGEMDDLEDSLTASIQSEQSARIAGDQAEASARTTLASTLRDEIAASVQTEATTRANADNVFTGLFTLLGAKNSAGTAFVLNDNKVQLSNGTALGTRLSGIDAQIANNAAAIVNEQTARANADSALSQSIQVVSSSVNGLTSSVSTLQQAVDGVKARYGVSLDVNGYVTGFVQNNDGRSGSFTVVADRFAVVDPNGGSPFVPFEVSGGVTRIKSALIGELQVDKLTNGTLWANVGLNGDINVGTGRIVWDNGVYMKVAGVGFGSSNQFIEWFGPKMAISQCSETNAIQYLKTDGSAYFGGSLSAGTLTNKATTSLTADNAKVALGPFGSNGGPKQVTLSYSFQSNQRNNGSCPVPLPTPTAKVVLYKGEEGDTSNPVATLNVSGETDCVDGFGENDPGFFRQTMSGSVTWTDNSTALSGYQFWAQITSRNTQSVGSYPIGITQRVTIISTEQ